LKTGLTSNVNKVRAKVRAKHVLLTFSQPSVDLTKFQFLVVKTPFLGNGARCWLALGNRRSILLSYERLKS
jgi:hypothetical protein